MSVNIEITRLNVSLQGISAPVIEEAVQGLEGEIRRKLQGRNIGQGLSSQTATVDLAELAIAPIRMTTTLDAGALRGLIAERLVATIAMQTESAGQGEL